MVFLHVPLFRKILDFIPFVSGKSQPHVTALHGLQNLIEILRIFREDLHRQFIRN